MHSGVDSKGVIEATLLKPHASVPSHIRMY